MASTWGTISLVTGLIVFLIGYYYLSYAMGQRYQQGNLNSDSTLHFNGGIAGIVIGVVIMIVGLYLSFSTHGHIADERTFGYAARSYVPDMSTISSYTPNTPLPPKT